MTPIGNPQNLLIAIQSGVKAPFIIFLVKLTVPTILNILITALVLQGIFRIRDQRLDRSSLPRAVLRNRRDALLAGVGLVLAVVLLVVNDLLELYGLYGLPHAEHRGIIPFILAAGTYLFTTSPRRVLSEVDWGTIVFFITMFITMDGVWRSGVLQPLLSTLLPSRELGLLGVVRITVTSILMSQLLSNVPFVKLFSEYMRNIGYSGEDVDSWLTLAMSSTIAGNLTLLGAASNIIILEVLESRMNSTITFTEFLKIGSIVTVVNTIVYLIFLLCFT
jgi:Na+/H+ antiporter NhaD/arsenite permease-like protein